MAPPPSPLMHCATPVLRYIDEIRAGTGERRIIDQATPLLAQFEADAARAGVPEVAIKPARYGLAMLLDQTARQLRGLTLDTWAVLARRSLFEGRDIDLPRVRTFRETAQAHGLTDLEGFLGDILRRAEALRAGPQRRGGGGWGWKAAAFALLLIGGLIAYAGALEVRFQRQITRDFEAEALNIGLDRPQEGAELVQRLDALRAAADRVAQVVHMAPLRRMVRLPGIDSETRAEATYAEAARRQLPPELARAIEQRLATEGDGLALYDTLRAWEVLTGAQPWQPGYLAGWLEDHGAAVGRDGLARHVAPLTGPVAFVPQDSQIMDQARVFAAEVPEPDRAWLELLRADAMRALPPWRATQAVPGVEAVLLRRSGRPLSEGLPGLFTTRGWQEARQTGVGLAVQTARTVGPEITGRPLPRENDTPDLLLDRLHRETVAAWKGWLADLRVRPFGDRTTAIEVSGHLSQPENPLTRLLRAVWDQSGGTDRSRTHDQQLLLAREFGPMIQYVEEGRMAEITRLFASLNVALGALDIDARRASRRLMTFQDRSRSIAALNNAPRIVVQIAEDVLAQSARADDGASGQSPLARRWQQDVFGPCRDTVSGRFPFETGPDASPGAVTALLGPQGTLTSFLTQVAQPLLETGESPWRWKPEARFAGLSPESAEALERAARISQALFGADGRLSHQVTLSALAERGRTVVSIGGRPAPVRASGAPATLDWPGPAPDAGVEVAFQESAEAARLIEPGPWGLYRLIDGTRLRLRDDGARALLDLRNASGRVFLELGFPAALNPVSARPLLQGFRCPATL
ncbi:ImcF-related family protein [Maritimibacter alkaliphilus]|uniref:ImcF-related family protein n=1 Tax=Maritimibacter alkaliphilus TaxID=404236 RepID=UPI001C93D0B3|nr:ImcF-related family protein [Maritimibacter alkaliphilus]MBY6089226.1 DotU family type IV/VI secretion system protein [Maritimibacter alkaliphilus]